MPVTTPEYVDLINQLTEQKKRALSTADAQAQGEAQRRGLVGQTGTSDIEMSLRGQKAAPIEQAYTGQIAQMMKDIADQESARKYQTSERQAGQQFQSGENTAQRGWQTGERVAGQQYGTGERQASQTWQDAQNEANRKYQTGERLSTQDWNALQSKSEQEFQNSQRLGTQGFQTSERIGQQQYGTGERVANQVYGTNERKATQAYGTGERQATQGWQAQQGGLERAFQQSLADQANTQLTEAQKRAARDWWKQPAGGIAGAVGGQIGGKVVDRIFQNW